MQFSLKNYVSSFVYNLQRVFRMPSDSQARLYPELYLGNYEVDIKGYTLHLRDCYGGRPKEDMTALRVVRASLMKNLGVASAEHESLQLELRDPNGGAHFLYFERLGRDTDDAPESEAAQPDAEVPRCQSMKEGDALGVVTASATKAPRAGEACMRRLEFEEEPTGDHTQHSGAPHQSPAVYHIAVLTNTLNMRGPQYHLWNNNCYCFSGLLYDMLKRLYPSREVIVGSRHGTWKHVPMYSPATDSGSEKLSSVICDYQVALETFEAEIADRHRKVAEAEARVKELEEQLEAYKLKYGEQII